ncbi:Alpha/beta knot methyltransferase [Delphinella strobiligena]|nr:Alpha/beta knot methyltransferase [Delphinella strobiligena]
MDKMTDGRPHNGVILEVSPLPVPAVEQLGKVDHQKKQIPLSLSRTQTAEERALHGTSQALPAPTDAWRQPFVLLLDGILDPGNLGNILRTAYFYGVDAVAICVNTCAPLTSSALHKAASGATEELPILAIQRPADFVSASSRNGWRVHAAVAPEGGSFKHTTRSQFATNKMVSPLTRAPSILMMGAEGEGLRLNLKNKAGHYVVIAGQQRHAASDMGVDSLNVSAATAVLIEAFMRPPMETKETWKRRVEETNSVETVSNNDSVEEKDDEKLF